MTIRRKDDRQSTTVLEKSPVKTKQPRLYAVLLLNDDFTPMDFVVVILQKFFKMDREQATRVMMAVHQKGKGVCGVYPHDLAATKVAQVGAFARQHQYPLACVMEES